MSELGNDIAPDTTPSTPVYPPGEPSDGALLSETWRRRLRLLSHFFTGQLLIQGLNFLVGFLLLRWMSVDAFAQYSVGWAFQSTVGSLVDLGFTGSIISLVGSRANDPAVLGRYIRTARYFRIRSFFIVLVVSTAVYPFVVASQPWGWQIKVLLYVGIIAGLAAQNLVMYASALLIARELKSYYRAQVISALWRQGAYAAMYFLGKLSSWGALWVSAAAVGMYGILYRRAARPLIQEPLTADPETNREMIRYIAPLMPGVVFAALQSQITVGVITLFGRTQNIAEVGALGRLSQLFTLLAMFNSVVVEPYIARIDRAQLLKRYLQVIGAQLLAATVLIGFAARFPGILLWLIGPKYAHLRAEVPWIAATASIGYLCGGMWTMNSARRWIYWWGTAFYISLIMVTQIFCVKLLDLSSTHQVVIFGLATSLAVLVVHIANALYGFRYGPPIKLAADHG